MFGVCKAVKLSNIQKKVLNTLVDRYERRRGYGSAEKSPRRTLLRIGSKSFPDYFHVSNSSFRLMFNAEMEALEHRGFVTLEWVRFDRGHTLERAALVENMLPAIYQVLERRSKKEIYREAAEHLAELKPSAPTLLHSYYDKLLHRLAAYEPLPSPLRPEKHDELIDLLRGFNVLFEPRDEETAKRTLSVQLYGDSKRWQQLEKGILQLLRDFYRSELNKDGDENEDGDENGDRDAETGDAALLEERGIVNNPGHIHLAGPLVISTPKGKIDLSSFEPDLGLPTKMIKELAVADCPAKAVLTVENLTSFYQYVLEGPPERLVIYLGGFAGTARRLFLQKLYRFFHERGNPVPFYHWGDLDLGGFKIWHDLREKTGIPIQPYLMDEETYLQYLHLGQPITEQYAQKLAALLEDDAFAPFHALITLILEKKIRLEQEAISLLPQRL